ncbi:LacI family DNA-binding transcriptional regulator [Pseudonocardia sp. C8]|uniref:LacI family DNA-binding transcriptional regulator n=1 Tax=Pseudonocardia sp. C8 TaxID=2762759 RepID=UPI001643597A|nr:LacI family DNA-binding transcriptional regulator [Pseudonocardia sp. C8]
MSRSGVPSLIDVARRAGVSTATAGRALGGYGQVREDTRTRVQNAAAELGYRSNGLARSMITGSTRLIGVIVTDVANPFFASALRGITDTTQAAGFDVLLSSTGSDLDAEVRAARVMSEKRADGTIVAAADPAHAAHLARLDSAGVPLVLLDRQITGLPGVGTVMVDHAHAMQDAVQHLLALGHRDIGIVTEATADRPDHAPLPSRIRFDAYLAEMAAAGIEVPREWVATAAYDRAAAYAATMTLLTGTHRPTALVCTDSVLASGAFRAVQDRGIAVPRDLSIIGFDDDTWTTLVRPELTVVAQPSYELGEYSARHLIGRITDDGEQARDIRLRATLAHRASTAPPPPR